MSKYNNLLEKLRKEIQTIESIKKKKKWKTHQKIMIDFIFGSNEKAIFEKNGHEIVLSRGDENKGFMHILLRHYKSNDLETIDIINIFEIYFRGIKLENDGVSNQHLIVYMKLGNQKEFRLVLNPVADFSWIITAYRKN